MNLKSALQTARRIGRILLGRHSRRIAYLKLSASTLLPSRTLGSRIRRKMARDRRPILTQTADKHAVRSYVRARIGARYLTELYQVVDRPEDLAWDHLPEQFVAKATHGSGGIVIVWEGAPEDAHLPVGTEQKGLGRYLVHPSSFDRTSFASLAHVWLSQDYSWIPGRRKAPEWAYQDIEPRIIVEELLLDGGGLPDDYKLHVIGGQVRVIRVSRRGAMAQFHPDWRPLNAVESVGHKKYPPLQSPPGKPDRLPEMIRVAETLAEGLDFVRVDLYCLPDRVVFGEMTHYPANGKGRFDPPHVDRWLADFWPS